MAYENTFYMNWLMITRWKDSPNYIAASLFGRYDVFSLYILDNDSGYFVGNVFFIFITIDIVGSTSWIQYWNGSRMVLTSQRELDHFFRYKENFFLCRKLSGVRW